MPPPCAGGMRQTYDLARQRNRRLAMTIVIRDESRLTSRGACDNRHASVMQKVIGIICLVAGVGLIIWGRNMAQSVGGQLQNAFTGSPGDKAMYCYIGGAILCAAGLFQLLWKRK